MSTPISTRLIGRGAALAALATLAVTTAAPRLASAGELDLAVGLSAGQSSEPDDAIGFAEIRGAYALRPWLLLGLRLRAGQSDEGYAKRSAGSLSAGVEFHKALSFARVIGRVGFIHQHEQPYDSVVGSLIESALGVHEDIGHRSGVAAGVGLAIPVYDLARGELFVGADLSTEVFVDSNGPRSYVIGGASLGWRRHLGARPTPKQL